MITDPNDPRVEMFRKVRDRDLKRDDGLFIGEGPLTVDKMLSIPGVVESVFVADRWQDRFQSYADQGVEVLVAQESLMSEIIGFKFHRGVLAAGRRASFDDKKPEDILAIDKSTQTLLIIDGVTNVDNIGLLFRNAAAFGCDAVLLSPSCCDPLYRKALRVSLGHVLSVPFAIAENWPSALRLVRERDFTIVAATLSERSQTMNDCESPKRVAIVVGQERHGVSEATLEASQLEVKIPMAPGVDSLNVAAASAVLLHHFSQGERL